MRTVPFVIAAALGVAACSDVPSRVTAPSSDRGHINATLIGTDANPSPSGDDRVLVDTRASLQRATSLAQAWSLFRGNDHSGARTAAGGLGWSFVRNFDGAGTSALRADWPLTKRCTDQTNRIINYLPDPLPLSLYVQWTTRYGRHPADAGGNGPANFYTIENTACPNASAYMMSFFRDEGDGNGNDDGDGDANFKAWFAGRPQATALFEHQGLGDQLVSGNQGWTFAPSRAAGRAVRFTVFLQGSSRPGARDGALRVWIDGRLYLERTGIKTGARGIDRFEFPGWRYGTVAESEYIWDVVAWAPPLPPPARMSLSPASTSIETGATAGLDVKSYDANGRTVPNGVVRWTSSDETVATVGPDGTVSGVGVGVATITATTGPVSATATVTVTTPVPARLEVSPSTSSIQVAATAQLTVTAYSRRGGVVNAGAITWSSSDPRVATVDATGMVTGVAGGKATITASAGRLSGSAEVKVAKTGPKVTLVVTLSNASLVIGQTTQASFVIDSPLGSMLPMNVVRPTWTSSNTAVATVTSSGVVTAVAPGTTNIVASLDAFTGQAALTVTAPAGSNPMPGPGATIYLDMRKSLQKATTIADAFALFGIQDHTPFRDANGPNPNGSGWSFTTNADGNGLHALRADWSVSPADQGLRVIQYFPNPKPTEVYAQWKNRLGKYAADADANGANDSYAMYPQSQACKRALFDRPDDKNRVDFTLGRFTPEQTKVEMGDHNYSAFGDPAVWNPNRAVGGAPYTTTVHVRTASSDLVNDGIFQLWIDGRLLIDRNDVPAQSEVFDRWSFPETCVLVPQPQSEYFWDILVWRP